MFGFNGMLGGGTAGSAAGMMNPWAMAGMSFLPSLFGFMSDNSNNQRMMGQYNKRLGMLSPEAILAAYHSLYGGLVASPYGTSIQSQAQGAGNAIANSGARMAAANPGSGLLSSMASLKAGAPNAMILHALGMLSDRAMSGAESLQSAKAGIDFPGRGNMGSQLLGAGLGAWGQAMAAPRQPYPNAINSNREAAGGNQASYRPLGNGLGLPGWNPYDSTGFRPNTRNLYGFGGYPQSMPSGRFGGF